MSSPIPSTSISPPVEDSDPDFHHPGEPPLADLFNKKRFLPFSSSYLFLICWFPFGVITGILRMILFPLLYMPLDWIFIKFGIEPLLWSTIGRFIFGINTVVRNNQNWSSDCPIVVSNHQTDFDGIGVMPIINVRNYVALTSVFLRPLLNFGRYLPMEVIIRETDPEKKHETREKILRTLENRTNPDRRLFVMPEGATTNGKVGLLMYNKYIFSLNHPIQPLALRVNSHLPLNIDKPSKNMLQNYFFLFFCPYVTFEFNILPAQKVLEGETPEQFAYRVQKLTADFLGLACTTYSYKHKNKLRKVVR